MKELLKQYAAYNTWATQRLLDVIMALPATQHTAPVESSFNSLYKTVYHMWDAESIWWQRLKLQEHIVRPSDNDKATMQDIVNGLLQQSRQWEEWVATASELSLDHVFQFQTTKREVVKMPVFQMLQHIFNHGSYHRGQLVTMLRQLGASKLPSTDFSNFVRGRK